MRITLFVLAWSLCSIAAAQTPDRLPAPGQAAPADVTAPTTDLAQADSAPPKTGTLYMCKFENDSPLFTINPSSGAVTKIGSMSINQECTDLAFRKTAASGTQLFGTSFTNLFLINPATGQAKLLPNAYGSNIRDINALVAQPGTGILYGAGSTTPGEFIVISPSTGKATQKGSLGTGISSAGDLEFLKGQLYGLVNKSGTGSETYLAKISLSTSTLGRATNLLLIRRQEGSKLVAMNNVWGLANRDGILYATMETGEVLTISPATGIATLKGDKQAGPGGARGGAVVRPGPLRREGPATTSVRTTIPHRRWHSAQLWCAPRPLCRASGVRGDWARAQDDIDHKKWDNAWTCCTLCRRPSRFIDDLTHQSPT